MSDTQIEYRIRSQGRAGFCTLPNGDVDAILREMDERDPKAAPHFVEVRTVTFGPWARVPTSGEVPDLSAGSDGEDR